MYNRKDHNPEAPMEDVPEDRRYDLGFHREKMRWENDPAANHPWNPKKMSIKSVLRVKQEKQRDNIWLDDNDSIALLLESGVLTMMNDIYIHKGKIISLSEVHRLIYNFNEARQRLKF